MSRILGGALRQKRHHDGVRMMFSNSKKVEIRKRFVIARRALFCWRRMDVMKLQYSQPSNGTQFNHEVSKILLLTTSYIHATATKVHHVIKRITHGVCE